MLPRSYLFIRYQVTLTSDNDACYVQCVRLFPLNETTCSGLSLNAPDLVTIGVTGVSNFK